MAKRKAERAKSSEGGALTSLWGLVVWLTGILVSLAVGFGMVDETLIVPTVPSIVTITAGWIVIVLIILGALLKIIDKASK